MCFGSVSAVDDILDVVDALTLRVYTVYRYTRRTIPCRLIHELQSRFSSRAQVFVHMRGVPTLIV